MEAQKAKTPTRPVAAEHQNKAEKPSKSKPFYLSPLRFLLNPSPKYPRHTPMASRVTRLLLHRRLATAAEASARRAPQAPCAGAAASKVIQQQRWRKTLNPSKPPLRVFDRMPVPISALPLPALLPVVVMWCLVRFLKGLNWCCVLDSTEATTIVVQGGAY